MSSNDKKIKNILIYNSLLLLLFFAINSSLSDDNFSHTNLLDSNQKNSSMFYYTVNVHTTTAMGDIRPISFLARAIFSIHLFFSFVGNAYIILT